MSLPGEPDEVLDLFARIASSGVIRSGIIHSRKARK